MTFSIDQFRLDDKVAVVTGAGGRGNSIGRAYAIGLASAGASVVVAALNAEGASGVCDEIRDCGGNAITVGVDITDPASVGAMAEAAQQAQGAVSDGTQVATGAAPVDAPQAGDQLQAGAQIDNLEQRADQAFQ